MKISEIAKETYLNISHIRFYERKDLQDSWENVCFDLTTERQPDGAWKHKYDNKLKNVNP